MLNVGTMLEKGQKLFIAEHSLFPNSLIHYVAPPMTSIGDVDPMAIVGVLLAAALIAISIYYGHRQCKCPGPGPTATTATNNNTTAPPLATATNGNATDPGQMTKTTAPNINPSTPNCDWLDVMKIIPRHPQPGLDPTALEQSFKMEETIQVNFIVWTYLHITDPGPLTAQSKNL